MLMDNVAFRSFGISFEMFLGPNFGVSLIPQSLLFQSLTRLIDKYILHFEFLVHFLHTITLEFESVLNLYFINNISLLVLSMMV